MATLKIALYFYTPKKLQGGNPQCIKKHRSDTDSLYLYGAEIGALINCAVPQKSCYGGFRLRRLMD